MLKRKIVSLILVGVMSLGGTAITASAVQSSDTSKPQKLVGVNCQLKGPKQHLDVKKLDNANCEIRQSPKNIQDKDIIANCVNGPKLKRNAANVNVKNNQKPEKRGNVGPKRKGKAPVEQASGEEDTSDTL